jgi:heparan-alpha-glucosaminide N-acetyltransferase
VASLRGWVLDVASVWRQAVVVLGLVLVYVLVQTFAEAPGCGRGYIGPGGISDYGRLWGAQCTGGVHGAIDRALFGPWHMYHSSSPVDGTPVSAATCAPVYFCDVYDPEGLLGAIGAILMAWLGLQAGRAVARHRPRGDAAASGALAPHGPVLVRLVAWGLALASLATGLAGASQNEGVLPLNKNLWSPSFVTLQAGTGALLLSVLYVVIDVRRWWAGTPFLFAGLNSIVVYVGSEVFQMFFPFTVMSHPLLATTNSGFATHSEALATNLGGVAAWMLVAYALWTRGITVHL